MMSWLTPELTEVIIAVLKAIVILLAVVITGALLSWVERRLLGPAGQLAGRAVLPSVRQ